MSIEQKYFPTDKNHLLKTVQAFAKDRLLSTWTSEAYQGYLKAENPLGLEDDFTLFLKSKIQNAAFILEEAYDLMAAIYRLRHGDNQLSFMWDGRTHMEYYEEEWTHWFRQRTTVLCEQKDVYRVILKAALADHKTNTLFLKATLRRALLRYFQLKLTRTAKLMSRSA
jgi:hypothetical protein